MRNDLIRLIARDLGIPFSTENERLRQIVYSSAGKMALASLWEQEDGEKTVSIEYFKSRLQRTFDAFCDIFPLELRLSDDRSGLIGDIYDIYRRTGHFYHQNKKISPAAPASAPLEKISLLRGVSPASRTRMSGLSFYTVRSNIASGSPSLVAAMFGLPLQPTEEYLRELTEGWEWEPLNDGWLESTEFLRLEPPFSRGYWQPTPYYDKALALGRNGEFNKTYFFYRYEDGRFLRKVIPEWRVRDFRAESSSSNGEYRRIAAALLKANRTLPQVNVTISGGMADVKPGYRFPPAEEDFFRLYSWPTNYDITEKEPQVFRRKMTLCVYSAFKAQMEASGYCFVEDNQ